MACDATAPAEILDCLEAAYSDRDIAALEQLLADDYAFHYGGARSWDKEAEMSSSENMFRSELVVSLDLELTAPTVTPGDEPGEWWLENVETRLVVRARDKDGEPQEYTVQGNGHRFGVREVTGPARFQVFSWFDPGR